MLRSVSAEASVLGQCWPESYVGGDVTASCISFCPITIVFNYVQVIFLVLTSTSDEFGPVVGTSNQKPIGLWPLATKPGFRCSPSFG
jgi:hypothetical protein